LAREAAAGSTLVAVGVLMSNVGLEVVMVGSRRVNALKGMFRRVARVGGAGLGALALILGVAGTSTSSASTSGSISGLYGSLPTAGTPTTGGTITFGFLTGLTPLTVFPITTDAQDSVFTTFEFQYNFWVPLYNGPDGQSQEIDYAVSVGKKPTFSDGNKTVTIPLNTNYKWSNGQPVDANDLVFDIDLMEAAVKETPANLSSFAPGLFPSNIKSISASSKYTVVIHLAKALNPAFFLNDELESETGVTPLPSTAWNIASAGGPHLDYTKPANAKKIYDYLEKLGSSISSFGTSPLWKIADGPFILKTFNPSNSSWTSTRNPDFGGSPKPAYSALDGVTYTSQTAMINALKTGALDISTNFDPATIIPQVPSLKAAGYSVYGYPDLSLTDAIFNFKDATDHFNSIIAQPYVRAALAHLEDEPAYVTGVFKGAAGAAYGPVPSVPPTPFTPQDSITPPYPYSPSAAVALLKSHGWDVVPGGQTTCAKPGAGAGECGAGIPKGTPFKFSWAYLNPASQAFESVISEAFASEAKAAAGINISLSAKAFNFLIGNYNDANPAGAKYTNDWGVEFFGGFTDDYWPTTNALFNTGGTYNQGDFDNATMNQLIHNSVYGTSASAVTQEASYVAQTLPALFIPNPDLVYAVSNKIGGTAASWFALTQYQAFPEYWYVKK
jgi:peptide/nickel transport system substrate-binding protein